MKEAEIIDFIGLSDGPIAEEIQRIMEEEGIYSLLQSNNPASSVTRAYLGSVQMDYFFIKINKDDYTKAKEIVITHGYEDFLIA